MLFGMGVSTNKCYNWVEHERAPSELNRKKNLCVCVSVCIVRSSTGSN